MNYKGSNLFLNLSNQIGLPIYQLNFLIVQFIALLSGLVFRSYLKPCQNNVKKRHIVAFIWGISLNYFCFGYQILHLIAQTFISYLIIALCPRNHVHWLVFIYSMVYLSALHLYGQINDYGNYTLDITSPMMITTQKLTSLAFAYFDGGKSNEELSNDQKSQAIRSLPSFLELFSYIFNFQGTIVGPLCFYNDYINFITGDNLIFYNKGVLIKKLLCVAVIAILFFLVTLKYPPKRTIADEMMNEPLWYRFYYFMVSIHSSKLMFYLAWTLADAVNNASGLGFNGYDSKGNPKWDLVSNINIYRLETSTSPKVFIDNWNIQTQLWLRRIAYDRLKTGKTLGVFVLSAFWHGFYPGYYFSFVTISLLVYAGRGIRRRIRPYFLNSKYTIKIYALITWFLTITVMGFAIVPFYLLDFWSSFKFYNQWYWFVQLISIIIVFAFPCGSTKNVKSTK